MEFGGCLAFVTSDRREGRRPRRAAPTLAAPTTRPADEGMIPLKKGGKATASPTGRSSRPSAHRARPRSLSRLNQQTDPACRGRRRPALTARRRTPAAPPAPPGQPAVGGRSRRGRPEPSKDLGIAAERPNPPDRATGRHPGTQARRGSKNPGPKCSQARRAASRRAAARPRAPRPLRPSPLRRQAFRGAPRGKRPYAAVAHLSRSRSRRRSAIARPTTVMTVRYATWTSVAQLTVPASTPAPARHRRTAASGDDPLRSVRVVGQWHERHREEKERQRHELDEREVRPGAHERHADEA